MGLGRECSHREQTEEAMELLSGWGPSPPRPPILLRLVCLPSRPALSLGTPCVQRKARMPPLPLVSSVHASPGPTCHTWHPSNDLQCTCCCWNYLCKSPLWEGGSACSFTAVLPVPRTVPSTQQADNTTCGMNAPVNEVLTKDEALHFSLLTAAPEPETSV